MTSPFSSLARAPFCQSIGATSDGVPNSLSCLHLKALWQSSSLSSNICQNLSKSLLEDNATSGRFIVTTPWLT